MKPNLPPWPCIFEARRSRQRSEDSRRNPKRPKAQNRREEFQERKNSRTGFVCLCWPFVPESDNGPCPTVNRGLWAEKSRHQTDYIRVTQLLPLAPSLPCGHPTNLESNNTYRWREEERSREIVTLPTTPLRMHQGRGDMVRIRSSSTSSFHSLLKFKREILNTGSPGEISSQPYQLTNLLQSLYMILSKVGGNRMLDSTNLSMYSTLGILSVVPKHDINCGQAYTIDTFTRTAAWLNHLFDFLSRQSPSETLPRNQDFSIVLFIRSHGGP